MIGGVRAGDDGGDAALARRVDHRERGLPHAQQAHLAQVVEVVLVDHREARTMTVEGVGPLGFGRRQHRVEQRHPIAAVAHAGRGVQRAERRVRLPRLPELGIEPEEVRLAEKNVDRRLRRVCAGPVGLVGARSLRRP